MERQLSIEFVKKFEEHLLKEERSLSTKEKYLHDIGVFYEFMRGKALTKTAVLEYKSALLSNYAVTSANSMLAALCSFFTIAAI